MAIKYIDLFAGIGGFHAVASSLGWECVFASEIDEKAAKVYELNWGINPLNDITKMANDEKMEIPKHDVLFAGFPCQPFSKSGKQLGMEETRGTLFWNILKIIEARRPALVVLENVRNIAGPQHKHEWEVIIRELENLNYRVSDKPFVVSPHKITREGGGRPQIRERVFIVATLYPSRYNKGHLIQDLEISPDVQLYDPQIWNLKKDLPLDKNKNKSDSLRAEDLKIIQIWDELIVSIRKEKPQSQLPGFPLWTEYWTQEIGDDEKFYPEWKKTIIRKNRDFYLSHRKTIDLWLERNPEFESFPVSRKKLEWQARETSSLWSTLIHFRPSGIRAKKPNYAPALVAITQTPILASEKRKMSLREVARLQGLPEWFEFGTQPEAASFKQLGNGVSIGAVYQVLRAVAKRDEDLLRKTKPALLESIQNAPLGPDEILKN